MFNRPKIEMQGVTSCSVSHGLTLSAGAAGDIIEVQLPEFPVLNSTGGQLASYTDTSLSWGTGGTLTNEVSPNTKDDDLSNGDYWVDYTTGLVHGKRADGAGSETASYTALVVKTAESKRPVAEDNTDGIIATVEKPLNSSTYSPDVYVNTGTQVTQNIASPANIYGFIAKNTNAATRYLQFHNTAGVPAGGAVPVLSFLVPAGEVLPLGKNILQGLHFSNGLAMAWSTTEWTYTAATAGDHTTTVFYKS